MKIAAKYVWDVVRYFENEKTKGKKVFLWNHRKEFYRPCDFICLETFSRADMGAVNGATVAAMPIQMILQSLHRQLLLNSYYPCCLHMDVLFLYHQYLKENPGENF